MSLAADSSSVLSVLADLRREVAALKLEVVRLEGRVVELESERAAAVTSEGYEVVSSCGASAVAAPYSRLPERGLPVVNSKVDELSGERVSFARDIGLFLRRCLSGAPRGSSGRERIAAPSSVYIVCQSFDLEVFYPPKVFFSWGEAKSLVIRGGKPGQSIFVGVPSRQEAIIAIEASGCEVPAALLRH